ncbi:MAG: glycine cleavage system protein GcvH [Oscillospiraceae bacterium]|nr:glycine cleavage system protein GcvH [Oscillospiraceae bacterium]
MNTPKELMYTKDHEWVKFIDDTTVVMGITDYAQHALGDLVFVNLPEVGDGCTAGEPVADVESVKAVSDVFCPVTGTVSKINEELLDAPEKINEDPYAAWMCEISDVTDKEELLTAEQYEALVAEEE